MRGLPSNTVEKEMEFTGRFIVRPLDMSAIVLPPKELSDLDESILNYLHEEGRATPRVMQLALEERGEEPGVRQNVNRRLLRLEEHDHVENVYNSGLYELVHDPRRTDENGYIEIGKPCPWCGDLIEDTDDVGKHLRFCAHEAE